MKYFNGEWRGSNGHLFLRIWRTKVGEEEKKKNLIEYEALLLRGWGKGSENWGKGERKVIQAFCEKTSPRKIMHEYSRVRILFYSG